MLNCYYVDVGFYLDQIEGLYGSFRPSQVVLFRLWFSVAINNDDMDDNVHERYQYISQ